MPHLHRGKMFSSTSTVYFLCASTAALKAVAFSSLLVPSLNMTFAKRTDCFEQERIVSVRPWIYFLNAADS